jgi:hypothetical protein
LWNLVTMHQLLALEAIISSLKQDLSGSMEKVPNTDALFKAQSNSLH